MHNLRKTVGIALLSTLFACAFPILDVSAQTLNRVDNLSFGTIDFAGGTATGNVTLGTNGTVNYSGNLDGAGYGTPGLIELGGTVSNIIEIRCTSNATLSDGQGHTIGLNPLKISVSSGQTYTAATSCIDLDTTVLTHTLTGNSALDRVYLGGQLQTNGLSMLNAGFNTQNSGGSPATMRVVYQ